MFRSIALLILPVCLLSGAALALGPYAPTFDAVLVGTGLAQPHVGSNTLLAAYRSNFLQGLVGSVTATTVHRDSFYGDNVGGGADYTYSSAACTAPDNGAQVTAAAGGCWLLGPVPIADATIWGADPTGARDSAAAINAALATGRDVGLMVPGRYIVTADWVRMSKPSQSLRCGSSTQIAVVRPGNSAAPAVIMDQNAKGAHLLDCSTDHNGAQFVDSAYFPLSASDKIQYVPGTGVINNPKNKTAKNDGAAVSVLVMCDGCEVRGGVQTRGWDNDVMVANLDLTTGAQSLGPYNVRLPNLKTSYAGQGRHYWTPDFFVGCGLDIGTGVNANITDFYDEYSRVNLCVDEGGGASASIVNATGFRAQMTTTPFTTSGKMSGYYPLYGDPWHGSTIAGSAFFFGGSNRSPSTGQIQADYTATTCSNCNAIQPQGVGAWFSRFSNGVRLVNFKVSAPGLECLWAVGGTHSVDGTCDQPNALKGTVPATLTGWGAFPWPQTSAVTVRAANDSAFTTSNSAGYGSQPVSSQAGVSGAVAVLSAEQINTTLNLHNFKIVGPTNLDNPTTPNWNYDFVTGAAYTSGATGTASAARINAFAPDVMYGSAGLLYANAGSPILVEPTRMPAPTLGGSCSGYGSVAGGAARGSFPVLSACSAGTVTLSWYGAPAGWSCSALLDVTTPANAFRLTAIGPYYATWTGSIAAGDTLAYSGCGPF